MWEVTLDEVLLAISPYGGSDSIPSFIIRGCADALAPVLLHLSNLSVCEAAFPSRWKQAIVFPIFKAGDQCDVKNYTPIYLLCASSKVFDVVIAVRLKHYF